MSEYFNFNYTHGKGTSIIKTLILARDSYSAIGNQLTQYCKAVLYKLELIYIILWHGSWQNG